jgi:hypothetical protein
MFILNLVWSAFTLFLALTFWKQTRLHAGPGLEYSTRDRFLNESFGKFLRKMSMTVIILCGASAWMVWHSWFWAFMLLMSIPALAAVQIVRTKNALPNNYKRSLPR